MVRLLHEIYDTAAYPYKATGKFAYVTYCASRALVELGEDDPQWGDR